MRAERTRRERALRVAIAGALLVDVLVLGVDSYLLATRSKTTAVDLEDALDQFHSEEQLAAPTSTADPDATTPTPTAGAPVTDPSVTSTTAAPTAAEPAEPSATPAPTVAYSLPAAGVYRYRTSGSERTSLLGASHTYPAETYAVVRHAGGCRWHVRSEVVREHVDEQTLCTEPDRQLLLNHSRVVEFFGVKDGGTFGCDPPLLLHTRGDLPGATAVSDCRTSTGSSAVHMLRTTLGPGQLTIGGTTVDVLRYRVDSTLSGDATGTATDVYSVVAATGLVARVDRTIDAAAKAFGADIEYDEQVRYELVSLTPTT